MARARSSRRRWWLPHPIALVSLMVSLTLVVPAVYWFGPGVHRWMMIRDLTADDAERRERALNYVVRRAADDEQVRDGAIARLAEADDERHFHQLARALDMAGVWRRPKVPDDAWLRWLGMIAELPEPRSRLRAAQRLAAMADLADDARVRSLLEAMLTDDEASVRLNALSAAAELAGAADDRLPYEALIGGRTGDDEPAIAREAWVLLGLLDPVFGYSANWREAEPWVAEAMLWASVQTNPDRPLAAVEALQTDDVPVALRRAAAYALAYAEPAAAEAALLPVIEAELAGEPVDRIVVWRAVRGVPVTSTSRDALERLADHLHEHAAAGSVDRVELAALHRTGLLLVHARTANNEPATAHPAALRHLAALERWWLDGSASEATPAILPGPDAGDMVRLVSLAVTVRPAIDDLRPLLRHNEPAMRDLACVVAVERFERDVLEPVIAELLVDYHDGAKMSGAMLAGLTGWQVELLRERAGRQSTWAVEQMMRLALWMRGEVPEVEGQASRLLAHDELPRTSVLLAMLEREPASAWDDLLAPQGEPEVDLIELFDHYRWWYVARRYLPDDAPPVWWWADREAQRFQVQVLRCWYLLHRHAMRTERG